MWYILAEFSLSTQIVEENIWYYGINKVYLVRKKEVNFILSYYTNLSHTGQEKFTSFFRMVYTHSSLHVHISSSQINSSFIIIGLAHMLNMHV